MYKSILAPTDGSVLSHRGVMKAIRLARKLGARVTGFYVSPPYQPYVFGEYIPPDLVSPRQFEASTKKAAARALAAVKRAAAAAGVRCRCFSVTHASPAAAIVKAARRYRCDLIVMASHGRGGFSRLLLGSETQEVLTRSKVPVLVCR